MVVLPPHSLGSDEREAFGEDLGNGRDPLQAHVEANAEVYRQRTMEQNGARKNHGMKISTVMCMSG